MEVPPTEPAAVKIQRWASTNVMNVCFVKRKRNIQIEWRKATKNLAGIAGIYI
jgi:hypothetical protein